MNEEDKIILVDDAPKIKEIIPEEIIPAGKVKTHDGKIIDRTKACFMLREHPKDHNILIAADGTVYQKINGTLKRLTFKKGEKKRKEEMKKI